MPEYFVVWVGARRVDCHSYEELKQTFERFPHSKDRNDWYAYVKWYLNFQYLGRYSFNEIVKKKENK